MLCRGAAINGLPVHHNRADYIFWSFEVIGLILSQFENRVRLKSVRGGVGITLLHINKLNKTKSAIFVSLMCSLLPEDLHSKLILIINNLL